MTCKAYVTIEVDTNGVWLPNNDATIATSGSAMLAVACTSIDLTNNASQTFRSTLISSVASAVSVKWMGVFLSSTGVLRLVASCVSSAYSVTDVVRLQDGKAAAQDPLRGAFAVIANVESDEVTVAGNTNIQSCAGSSLAQAMVLTVPRLFAVCATLVATPSSPATSNDMQILLVDIDFLSFGFGVGGSTNRPLRNLEKAFRVEALDIDRSGTRFVSVAGGKPDQESELVTIQWPLEVPSSRNVFETSVLIDAAVQLNEQFLLIGRQSLPSTVISLSVDDPLRTLTCVMLHVTAVSVFSMDLFGLLEVYPTVVDAAGGGTVIISGNGFPTTNEQVFCEMKFNVPDQRDHH